MSHFTAIFNSKNTNDAADSVEKAMMKSSHLSFWNMFIDVNNPEVTMLAAQKIIRDVLASTNDTWHLLRVTVQPHWNVNKQTSQEPHSALYGLRKWHSHTEMIGLPIFLSKISNLQVAMAIDLEDDTFENKIYWMYNIIVMIRHTHYDKL